MSKLKKRSKLFVFLEWYLFVKPAIKFAYNRGVKLNLGLDSLQNHDRLILIGYEVDHIRGAMYSINYEEKDYERGNEIKLNEEIDLYVYSSDGIPVPEDLNRPCGHCGKVRSPEGHDACLGTLDGIMNACCSHGIVEEAYVQFIDGTGIKGRDAIIIQEILKRNNNNTSEMQKIEFIASNLKSRLEKINESLEC